MDKMNLILHNANEPDLPVLARMNKQLIDDEGSKNPMSIEELERRMKGWLLSDWKIDLISNSSETIGYALYQYITIFKEQKEVYLRQYYIKPDFRNQGYGHEGIKLLLANRFDETL